MIIVIQCAATKKPGAGYLISPDGKPVIFVTNPDEAPNNTSCLYARPDDRTENDRTWRDLLEAYNEAEENPLGLYQAYYLYENQIYNRLVDRFDAKSVYILSAGWGLISASFLTPYYDITFSQSAEPYKRRRNRDRSYRDLCMLPADSGDEVIFFGGKDYVRLFCALTHAVKGVRRIFYNAHPPHAPGCRLERFVTPTKTNWHYECAKRFLAEHAG